MPVGGSLSVGVQDGRKRRVLGAALKARVALAAALGEKTTAQLASEFGVHASQVTAWKKLLLERAVGLFDDGRTKPECHRLLEPA
jgi:transposase